MTTGATGQLGLALPVQGELSGTWGDTVNNGITQYTNIAIAATLTLTNDGAVTLANTTGDASASNITSSLTGAGTVTAQFAIVKITGTLTTTKVVTGPSYSKTYVVVNAATGGTVTFKASGQTGVSIAVGESAYVYYNGTDYVKIAGTTSGSAGGSNTQVQYNSSGSLAGSSNLTFDGTNLTLGGGTANGVTYLNGSKVLTSGSNFTYNNGLTVNGITQAYNTSLYTVDGTLSNYSATNGVYLAGNAAGWLNLAGDGTNATFVRIYGASYATPNIIQFNTASSEKMRLDASGNLGIGTSSPYSKLNLAWNSSVGINNGLFGTVNNSAGANNGYRIGLKTASDSSNWAAIDQAFVNLGTDARTYITFSTTDNSNSFAERARIDYLGNLGLGVTPSAWDSTFKNIQIGGNGFSGSFYSQANGDISNGIVLNAYFSSGWKYTASSKAATQYEQNNGIHKWSVAPSGTAGNAITFTQAMTLDASGNLGVGTSSPTAKFDLAGDYKEGVVTANTSTAYTISLTSGTIQILTLTGSCTYTFPTATAGKSFTLLQKQDATGSRTVTWPASVKWPSGTAPTITSTALKLDKFVFTADGTNWYGSVAGQNYTV